MRFYEKVLFNGLDLPFIFTPLPIFNTVFQQVDRSNLQRVVWKMEL